MKEFTKFGIILGTTCLLATLVLAVTYEITKPRIAEEFRKEEHEALKAILPEADNFTEKSIGDIDYFEASAGGKLRGYCVRVTTTGYSGYIRMLVGINVKGVIEGVEILEHYETPGLGAKINEIKPGEKDPWFLRQFKGKNAKTIEIKKEIDSITGATISSKAVTDGIRKAITEFLTKVEEK